MHRRSASPTRSLARSLAHAKMPNLPSIRSPSHVNRNPSPSLPPSHQCGGAKRGAGGRGRGREERVRACILFISLSREARAETFPIPRLLLRLLARGDRLRPRNAAGWAEGRGGRGGESPVYYVNPIVFESADLYPCRGRSRGSPAKAGCMHGSPP